MAILGPIWPPRRGPKEQNTVVGNESGGETFPKRFPSPRWALLPLEVP
jgi:hypothetical protein